MTADTVPGGELSVETSRLLLRPWRVAEAAVLASERKATCDVVGYCGLVDSGRGPEEEPELAFELLRRVLAKLGFTETGREEADSVYGTTLITTRRL